VDGTCKRLIAHVWSDGCRAACDELAVNEETPVATHCNMCGVTAADHVGGRILRLRMNRRTLRKGPFRTIRPLTYAWMVVAARMS